MRCCRGSMPGRGREELRQEHGDNKEDGQNVRGIGRRQIRKPQPVRLAQLDGVAQHFIEADQQRILQQHRHAAAEHVHAFLALQVEHLLVHFLAARVGGLVFRVFGLDGIHLRLDALHLERRLHRHDAGGNHGQVEDEGERENGPAPVPDAVIDEEAQHQQHGLGDPGPPAEADHVLQVLAVRRYGWYPSSPISLGPTKRRVCTPSPLWPTAAPSTGTGLPSFASGWSWLRGSLISLCSVTTFVSAGVSGIKTAAKYMSPTPA